MMIKNKTKKKIICNNSTIVSSTLSKAVGLMFSKKKEDFGLVFVFSRPVRADLHMFFVFYPIDVLFLDENMKVAEIKGNFRPFTFYSPKTKSKFVIELPEGSIKKSGTELSDQIEF